MVARGDLGIELPIEQVPAVQRHLLALAGQHSKPSITATQMLASMVASPRPTRAEVTDVANAIYHGTDAVMLSEETAVGEHPVEAVRVMDRIARETEPDLPYGDWLFNRVATERVGRRRLGRPGGGRLDLHASAWRRSSSRPAAAAPPGSSPRTGRRCRCSRSRRGSRRCAGSTSCSASAARIAEDWESLPDAARRLRAAGPRARASPSRGDLIGITAGLPEQELGTNLFEVHRVP